MKKFFTLCMGLIAALAMQAQSDFPLQFADKDGNIIADGTTLNITTYEADDFGGVQMPSGLYVKNISNEKVQGGGEYTIQSISNGAFQTCFPNNCVSKESVGTYTTGNGEFAAGVPKNMMTEWLPMADGSCQVVYQLVVFNQNPLTKEWSKDTSKIGPTVTLNFTYSTAGISIVEAGNDTKGKAAYYDLSGRRIEKPAKGLYIVNGRKVVIK